MRGLRILAAVVCTGAAALAQAGREASQETKPRPPQTVIELPARPANCEPLSLLDRAVTSERGLCAVHHHPLKAAAVPITYGLVPGPGRKFVEARRKHFPNAVTSHEGGCLVMCAKEARVLQCEKCLKAKAAWARRHPR